MKHAPDSSRWSTTRVRVKEINLDGYRKMLAEAVPHVLIDTREDSEWAAGHAKAPFTSARGSSSATSRTLSRQIHHPRAVRGGGYRSALAADNLKKMAIRTPSHRRRLERLVQLRNAVER